MLMLLRVGARRRWLLAAHCCCSLLLLAALCSLSLLAALCRCSLLSARCRCSLLTAAALCSLLSAHCCCSLLAAIARCSLLAACQPSAASPAHTHIFVSGSVITEETFEHMIPVVVHSSICSTWEVRHGSGEKTKRTVTVTKSRGETGIRLKVS